MTETTFTTDDTARALAALDALADAERAATPAPWDVEVDEGHVSRATARGNDDVLAADHEDAMLVIALRNAAPALLALARAAVHRADMWAGYVSGASGGDADEEYHAFELADAALDDATAALIAALAGEVDDGQ